MKPKNQKEIDAKAMVGKKAVGADDQGGQDNITPGQRVGTDQHSKPTFKGITHHGG